MSYIPHMDAPIHKITYNGVDLSTFGLYVSGNKTFDAPERDYERTEVPGRSGDLLFDNGRFKNVELHYEYCFIAGNFDENFSNLRNFLLSEFGYFRLEDTYHPDEYRLASFAGPIEVSMDAGLDVGTFDLVFNCKPQRYLISGETWNDLELEGRTGFFEADGVDIKTVSDYSFSARNGSTVVSPTPDPYEAANKGYYLEWRSPTVESYKDNNDNFFHGFDIEGLYKRENAGELTWNLVGGSIATEEIPYEHGLSIIDFFTNNKKTKFLETPDSSTLLPISNLSGIPLVCIGSEVPILGMGFGLINPDNGKYRSYSQVPAAGNMAPPTVRTISIPGEGRSEDFYTMDMLNVFANSRPTLSDLNGSAISVWWYPASEVQSVWIICERSDHSGYLYYSKKYEHTKLTATFYNPSRFVTKPVFKFETAFSSGYSYKTAKITLGSGSFTIDFSGKISARQVTALYLDMETGVMYDIDGLNYSDCVAFSGHALPALQYGNNDISITGDNRPITGVSIVPRWYKI